MEEGCGSRARAPQVAVRDGGARASYQRLSRQVPLAPRRVDALERRRVQFDVGAGRHRDRAHARAHPLSAGSSLESRPPLRGGVVGPRAEIRGSPSRASSACSCRPWDAIFSFRYRPLRAARPLGWRLWGSGTWMALATFCVPSSHPPRSRRRPVAPPATRPNDSRALAGLARAAGGRGVRPGIRASGSAGGRGSRGRAGVIERGGRVTLRASGGQRGAADRGLVGRAAAVRWRASAGAGRLAVVRWPGSRWVVFDRQDLDAPRQGLSTTRCRHTGLSPCRLISGETSRAMACHHSCEPS